MNAIVTPITQEVTMAIAMIVLNSMLVAAVITMFILTRKYSKLCDDLLKDAQWTLKALKLSDTALHTLAHDVVLTGDEALAKHAVAIIEQHNADWESLWQEREDES